MLAWVRQLEVNSPRYEVAVAAAEDVVFACRGAVMVGFPREIV